MNKIEIEARHEIELEEYAMRIQIEGRILGDIARNHVIPTAIRYQNILIENVRGLKEIYTMILQDMRKSNWRLLKVFRLILQVSTLMLMR